MNWKHKYNLIICFFVSGIFWILIAKFFIKPIIQSSFPEHCLISEFVQTPDGKQAIVYKDEKLDFDNPSRGLSLSVPPPSTP